jgi:arylsulfatase A-like enzyme
MNFQKPIIKFLGISAVITSCINTPSAHKQAPNIIYIMSDDHAYQAISAYEGALKDLAPTPNIDRIANNGMLFNRCLVTNSISGPCRAVVLTGKYSHKNGYMSNIQKSGFDGSQQTFPKLLQQTGYNTAMIGKWHLGSTPSGFNYWEVLPGQGNYYNPDFIDKNGTHKEDGYVTEIITEKCLKWLKMNKNTGKPFMLMMHHKAPHSSWYPGPDELNLYKNTKFPEPPTLFDDYSDRGTAEKSQDMTILNKMRIKEDLKLYKERSDMNSTPLKRLTTEQLNDWNKVYDPVNSEFFKLNPEGDDLVSYKYQRFMQDYLACIASVDKSVGKILDFLKENNLEKNTVVVYASDQGFYLGEHGWYDKRWMFEESYRTPLLIQWPGITTPGQINNDMVSNIDFAETFLDMAGVKIPSDMQGRSMVPILKGETPADWRKEHFYHYYEYPGSPWVKRHYGISTERYKLIHFYYDIDEWELFDLQEDPREMKNVYNDPAYSSIKQNLHKRLIKLMKKFEDSEELAVSFLPESIK